MTTPTQLYFQRFPPNITDWLFFFAADTWDRIRFCRSNPHNRIFETTITQNLVYEFLVLRRSVEFPMKIFESRNEKANGNDLEIVLKTNGGYFRFPCQCKLIGRDQRYEGFYHQSSSGLQIDHLLAYAKRVRGVPIYLLYNFSPDEELNQRILVSHQQQYIESFGCSFTFARLIHERYFPKGSAKADPVFSDIHLLRGAWPFHLLPRLTHRDTISRFARYYSSYLHFTGTDEVMNTLVHVTIDNEDWIDLSPPAAIGRISTDYPQQEIRQAETNEPAGFYPAYRVIIG